MIDLFNMFCLNCSNLQLSQDDSKIWFSFSFFSLYLEYFCVFENNKLHLCNVKWTNKYHFLWIISSILITFFSILYVQDLRNSKWKWNGTSTDDIHLIKDLFNGCHFVNCHFRFWPERCSAVCTCAWPFFLFVAADWTKLQTFMYFFFKPGNACVVRRFSFLNFVL